MNEGKTMCRKNTWHKAVMAMMALVVLVIIMPLTVSAGNEITGTIGDNAGITWTYDADTKTLTLTGEDSGLQGWYDNKAYRNVSQLEKLGNGDIKHIVLENCTIIGSATRMFAGLSDVESIEFKNVNTSKVTDMEWLFGDCGSLVKVDVSEFDTSKVTNMCYMFGGCRSLSEIDVSGFDTSKVRNMRSMFYNCNNLSEIDVSGFDISEVTDMGNMFGNCSVLAEVELNSFDTSNVTKMDWVFGGCRSLSEIDVSGFDTSKVTNMSNMFGDCSSLTEVDLSGFDTSSVKNMLYMLMGCNSLDTIHTPKVMADGQSIVLPDTFKNSKQNSTDVITSEFCNDILTRDINPFSDIKESSWQYASAKYAYDKGLMAGKGQGDDGNIIFDPNKAIPREEFVQVLYNASGKPAVSIENKFPDVKNAWYKNAVLWANANDIANGKGNGDFGVTESISRQDLALMLYKYARLNGYDLTANAGEINKYADGNKVSNYAKTAMDWAITKGVMSGKGTKGEDVSTFKLDPTGTATRAECAAMLKNFMEAYGK